MALGRESSRVLELESSWHNGVVVATPPLQGVVAGFDKELSGHVTVGASPEHNSV